MSLTVALLVCGLSVWVMLSILITLAFRLIDDLSYLYRRVGIGG